MGNSERERERGKVEIDGELEEDKPGGRGRSCEGEWWIGTRWYRRGKKRESCTLEREI